MGSAEENKNTPLALLRRLLSGLSFAWLVDLILLYRNLRLLLPTPNQGQYQILSYDSTLELLDAQGKHAVLHKQQQVRFLQDNVIAFQDYAWGDGETFADYRISPGMVVDRYQEGDRWNVLVSFRETKNSGDVENFYIERHISDGFIHDEEWWQVELRHAAQRLKLSALFPKERHCRRAVLLQRSRHRSTVLGPEHFTVLPDGRQRLTWETTDIRPLEIFTIKWRW